MIRTFLSDEAGSTAVEYALICSLISVAILVALQSLSQNTEQIYEEVASAVEQANGGSQARP